MIEIGLSHVLYRLPEGTSLVLCRQGQDKCAAPLTADARPGVEQARRLRTNLRKTIDGTIAVYNGRRSGTMFTIQYAHKKHVPVELLAG